MGTMLSCEARDVKFHDVVGETNTRWLEYLLRNDAQEYGLTQFNRGEQEDQPCLPTFHDRGGPKGNVNDFWKKYWKPDVCRVKNDILISFGAKGEIAGFGKVKELVSIMDGARGSAYLDAMRLPMLAGATMGEKSFCPAPR